MTQVFRRKRHGDRFIPFRVKPNLTETDNYFNQLNNLPSHEGPFLNLAKIRYDYLNYCNKLRSVMFPMDQKILNFHYPKEFKIRKPFTILDENWPVKAREKPVIRMPEKILDMPQITSINCNLITDWSCKNRLATIYESEIHIIQPEIDCHQENKLITTAGSNCQNCLKWSLKGDRLAVSLALSQTGVWELNSNKWIYMNFCCMRNTDCKVLCINWITDHHLITGCSLGNLTVHDCTSQLVKRRFKAHKCAIINMATSCNKQYLVTTSLDKTVNVWKLPDFTLHMRWRCSVVVRAVAWHPWREPYLAIGRDKVSLWNVAKKQDIVVESHPYENCTVDALTFNPLTAELVVSYTVLKDVTDANSICTIISFLTNIDTVVEELYLHEGRVCCFLWGQNGTVLASCGVDERMCLWEVFGKHNYEMNNNRNQFINRNTNESKAKRLFYQTIR